MHEDYPLSWPAGWPKTHPMNQRSNSSWKGTANKYRDALETELKRLGSPRSVISSNVPLTARGQMTTGVEPRDVGVAVYFSREKKKDDYSWAEILGIREPVTATEEKIQAAYKPLARQYHPDAGGDLAMFQKVTEARDAAIRWVNRKEDQKFDYVIACDTFCEVRLNMAAIVMTIKAIRQIERAGTSSLLERAFRGFSAIEAQAGPSGDGGARG